MMMASEKRKDADLAIWTRRRVLAYCAEAGLDSRELVATVLHISVVTVSAWARTPDTLAPARVVACLEGYDAWCAAGLGEFVDMPNPTLLWFRGWMRRNGVTNLARFAAEIGCPRQRAFEWFSDGKTPPWLALACMGLEARRRNLARI